MPLPDSPKRAAGLEDFDLGLLDALVVPASLHTIEGHYFHLNPAGEAATGYTSEGLRGRHFGELLPAESRKYVAEHFASAVDGSPANFEASFFDGSGRLIATRAQYVPLFAGATVIGVVTFAYDARPDAAVPTESARLTPRQLEILHLIAGAVQTGDIAEHLGISPDTVRNHIRDLLGALDAHSRLEAVVKAERFGLLPMRPLAAPDDTPKPARTR